MKVNVEGYGVYDISEEKLPQLLNVLGQLSAVRLREDHSVLERKNTGYTGRELLNG